MKYIVLLGDGMPDWPVKALGHKTPLEKAKHPHMDFLASHGRLGLARVIPQGMLPGSDIGHLSVLGYNPKKYGKGRAPIEAAALGIKLRPRDVVFRCNLVSLEMKNGLKVMKDFSAGHIHSKDSHPLIKKLQKHLGSSKIQFYPGLGHRHLMVWRNGPIRSKLMPPHDISNLPIGPHLPRGEAADDLMDLITASQKILRGNGTKANSIWLWGQGRATRLPKFPIPGGLISAVDIARGIGRLAGLDIIKVPGATGYFDTNYENKADYALKYLKKNDFVFVHVEATDEAGHMGHAKKKVMAIQDFDQRLIGRLLEGLRKNKSLQPYRILLTSDHMTPVALKTHTPDKVVFALYDSQKNGKKIFKYSYHEKDAKKTGDVIRVGHHMMKELLKGRV